jgi:hypothetical protein
MEFIFTIEKNVSPKSRPAICVNLLPQGMFYIYLYYHLEYVLFLTPICWKQVFYPWAK